MLSLAVLTFVLAVDASAAYAPSAFPVSSANVTRGGRASSAGMNLNALASFIGEIFYQSVMAGKEFGGATWPASPSSGITASFASTLQVQQLGTGVAQVVETFENVAYNTTFSCPNAIPASSSCSHETPSVTTPLSTNVTVAAGFVPGIESTFQASNYTVTWDGVSEQYSYTTGSASFDSDVILALVPPQTTTYLSALITENIQAGTLSAQYQLVNTDGSSDIMMDISICDTDGCRGVKVPINDPQYNLPSLCGTDSELCIVQVDKFPQFIASFKGSYNAKQFAWFETQTVEVPLTA